MAGGGTDAASLRSKYRSLFEDSSFISREEAFLSGALKAALNGAVVYEGTEPKKADGWDKFFGAKTNARGELLRFNPFGDEFAWGVGYRNGRYYATNAVTDGESHNVDPSKNPEMIAALRGFELDTLGHSHLKTLGLSGYDKDPRPWYQIAASQTDYSVLNGREGQPEEKKTWSWPHYTPEKGFYSYKPQYIMSIDPEGVIESGGLGSRRSSIVTVPRFDPATQSAHIKALFGYIRNGQITK